jgi:hypothetical protein
MTSFRKIEERMGMFVVLATCMASMLAGCGDDSLLISLPDGNELKYTTVRPSGSAFTASCSTENAGVYVDGEERSQMRIRCTVSAQDISGTKVPSAASIRIVAEVKEQGKSPQDGSDVTFITTAGSFAPFSSSHTTPVKEQDFSTTAGVATAILYSFPGETGEATVTASYFNINSNTVSDSTTIAVSPAIGVMVESGCPVNRVSDYNSDDFIFALSPSCDPKDVEPLPGEPSHMEQGIIHNPRDGLLSMVFYIDGEEGYDDSNGNGQYDPGEPFFGKDLAEPYVDANDNKQFDIGEPYLDVDGNGEWSDANGRWDAETKIWTTVRILFTGRPHESIDTTRFEPSGINIESGGSQTLTLYLMDIKHNPLAVNEGASDRISFTKDGGANISSTTPVSLIKTMGIGFTVDGNIIVDTFNEDRDYQVTLEDADPGSADSITLHTQVDWTPAPDFSGYTSQRQNEVLGDVSGTAN